MIHDLSNLLGANGNGIQLRLYSEFPFQNRGGRVLDRFAKDASLFLKTSPDGVFIRTDLEGEQKTVRVAVADKMIESACVNCHNTHPDTRKDVWKLNDVRGVLEIIAPIDIQMNNNENLISLRVESSPCHAGLDPASSLRNILKLHKIPCQARNDTTFVSYCL